MSLTTELNALLGRISTPAKEIRDMLVIKGAYDDAGRAAQDIRKGTEFTVTKTLLKTAIVMGGVDLTGVSTGGELILKRVTLQNDADAGTATCGVSIVSDDTIPLTVELITSAATMPAASTFYDKVVGFPLAVGKKVTAKAITTDMLGDGSVLITLIFVRNADGANIGAA